MKRLIYQVYTGKKSKLYDHCTASVKAYADRISVDYIVQTIPKMMIKPDVFATNRSKESYEKYGGFLPIYEKENALDYFDRYDQICIIDADIWVRPETVPNIFDELDNISGTTEFAGVVERMAPILPWYKQKLVGYTRMQYSNLKDVDWWWNEDGALFYNMGLMLMDKRITKYLRGQTGKQFIQRPEFKDFVDGQGAWKWSTDQTLLNYWVKKEKMIQKYLDWKWNALYTAIPNDKIKEAYFVHFFLKDKLPNGGENVDELMEIVK